MGYTTDFEGVFTIEPPLNAEQVAYLKAFSSTRRMRRNVAATATRADPRRVAVGLPVGADGSFFVGERGICGQEHGPDILDYNKPPAGQPGLWCQWEPSDEGNLLSWDGGEKFYHYTEWLAYLIKYFFAPWGKSVNGVVGWQGEDPGDTGQIRVTKNVIETRVGKVTYGKWKQHGY